MNQNDLGLKETKANNERCETGDGPLPIEHLREYDGAAEHFARHGELPQCMGSPGAIDWIQSDPEAFEQRVRETKYGIAMDKLNLPEGDASDRTHTRRILEITRDLKPKQLSRE